MGSAGERHRPKGAGVRSPPKLLGGRTAKTPVEEVGVPTPNQAFLLRNSRITQLGEDFLIESEVADRVHRHG